MRVSNSKALFAISLFLIVILPLVLLSQDYKIELQKGWSLIGNPTDTHIDVSLFGAIKAWVYRDDKWGSVDAIKQCCRWVNRPPIVADGLLAYTLTPLPHR